MQQQPPLCCWRRLCFNRTTTTSGVSFCSCCWWCRRRRRRSRSSTCSRAVSYRHLARPCSASLWGNYPTWDQQHLLLYSEGLYFTFWLCFIFWMKHSQEVKQHFWPCSLSLWSSLQPSTFNSDQQHLLLHSEVLFFNSWVCFIFWLKHTQELNHCSFSLKRLAVIHSTSDQQHLLLSSEKLFHFLWSWKQFFEQS